MVDNPVGGGPALSTTDRPYGGQSTADRDADRRSRLLDAALVCFGTLGYSGTTVEGVCSAAHVSTRSFYEIFAGKEDLLLAVYDRELAAIQARVVAALRDPADDFRGFARVGLKAFTDAVLEDDHRAQLVIQGLIGVSPRSEQRRRQALRAFAALISDGIQTFDPRISRKRELPVLSMALVGATIEVLIDWLNSPRVAIEDVLDELAHLYVWSVKP